MDNNEYFQTISHLPSRLGEQGQSTWAAPAGPPGTRETGTRSGGFGAFLVAAPLGLAADGLVVYLSRVLPGEVILLLIASILGLLVWMTRELPSRHAAGAVLGFVAGVLSPLLLIGYLLFTTPIQFG